MSKAQITEADLHAWLDEELPQSRRGEVEAYIAVHPAEGERLGAYRRNDLEIGARFDAVLAEPVPERLLRRPSAAPTRVWRYAAAIGWLFVGGLAGWQLHDVKA